MKKILEELAVQRWDDHRFYHHSRINQSLHLVSALSFVVAYGLLLIDPAWSAILAWCISMTSRQAGHFFFEPRGYDHVNKVSDAHKEQILWATPSVLGMIDPATHFSEYLHDVGMGWLALGVTGLLFRVVQLWMQQSLVTGLVWAMKILTDPFHDIMLYHRAPLYLLRGELIDPMNHVPRR
jgi:hypothetical protein